MLFFFYFRGDTGSLSINSKTRRIGRCHSSPYSSNSSSQSSDEELDQVNQSLSRGKDLSESSIPKNTILDNATSSHLENWVAHNDRVGVSSARNGSSLYQINGQIKQDNLERELKESSRKSSEDSLALRKDSGIETCDESSISGR